MKTILKTLALAFAAIATYPVAANATASPSMQSEEQIDWTEITLEMPGSLGFEALYVFDKLSDVRNLRVIGPLNDADWTSMKNMTNIENLDLSKAQSTSIPDNQFNDRTSLVSFLMPQGVNKIGGYAFENTKIESIEIPESVTSVGQSCFYNCDKLKDVSWKSDANISYYCFNNCDSLKTVSISGNIKSIGHRAFYSCRKLSDINLPSSLTSIGGYAFESTSSLKKILFPDQLSTIYRDAFRYSGLVEVKLPTQLKELGANYDGASGQVFCHCDSLKEVVMPSGVFSYYSSMFSYCTALKKITVPVATPPVLGSYVFEGCDLSKIELIVPEFSVVNYKLDTEWMKFGEIKGEVVSDYWAINSSLDLTNDRRMDGTPSVDLLRGAQLRIGGTAPATFDQLRIYNSMSSWNNFQFAQMINTCANTTANGVQFEIICTPNYWYFLSMPCDIKLSDISHSDGGDFVVRYYDGETRASAGTGNSWKDVEAGATLEAGKAYIFQTNKSGSFIMKASGSAVATYLSHTDRVVAVKAWCGSSAADNGWNLIGNPCPSYFDMRATSLSCPVTVWDHSNRKYIAYSLIDDDVVLSPFQAFFMQQPDIDGTVTFAATGRQFTTEVSPRTNKPGNTDTTRRLVNLALWHGGDCADRTRVVINPDASLAYEPSCDASKFFADNDDTASIYTIDADGNKLAINERPADNDEALLGISVPAAGSYTIVAERTDCGLKLRDNLTGSEVALTTGSHYSFTVDDEGNLDHRFVLIFDIPISGLSDMSASHSNVKVTTVNGGIMIEGADGDTVEIYTAAGAKVASVVASAQQTISLPAGFYIVKTAKTSEKCIVK